MKKRWIIIISICVVLLMSGGVFSGVYAAAQVKQAQQEEKLRAENSQASITEAFHDQANEYMVPLEPTKEDDITVRLRTKRYNVNKAQVQYTTDEGKTWQTADMSFEKHDDTGYFDFWVGKIPAQESIFYYRFICANDTGSYFVDRTLQPDTMENNTYSDCWAVSPGYHSADWAKGALWYNLSPDAFYNGDISGDVTVSDSNDINSWNHCRRTLADKYGGDLKGIAKKTDYIKGLYADAVFMNPFNRANQNVGYGPLYYDMVEPSFGNAQSLQDTLAALHNSGFKVGSDAVLTFTPYNSAYYNSDGTWPLAGAARDENSIWKDMFVFYHWPDNVHLSWSGPALDHSSKTLQELLYTNKNSYMQYYTAAPFNLDSWRFDCGGWLYGRTDSGYLNDVQVLSVIKKNLQAINPEIFCVSETSGYKSMLSTMWDSQWNFSLARNWLNGYIKGSTSVSTLKNGLNGTLGVYPRPIALSTYNLLTTHDELRQDAKTPNYMIRPAHLILMTYIGSPSIYYGDEINLERKNDDGIGYDASFYAMEWDESNWDRERYNLYKTLGELRSKYSALKTGAVRDLLLDSAQNVYAFGRWDDKGTVITVAMQNKETTTVDVEARLLSVKDGAVFTDWFTGKQYTVDENGMLHLDVIPGGSVFVSGKKAGQYRSIYTVSNLSRADANVYLTDTGVYQLEGNGKLDKADKLTLAATELYGAGSLSATAEGDGRAVLSIRQEATAKAAAYNVTIHGDKLTVTARKKTGGNQESICEAKYEAGTAVKIDRDGNNRFAVFTAKLDEDGAVSGEWTEVEGSACTIAMEYEAVIGFAPLEGSVTLKHVTAESRKDEVGFDHFDTEQGNALLTYSDKKNASVEDGALTLTAKDGITWANAQSKDDDWTFKAELDTAIEKEGSYAGVWCVSDEEQWVAAGRTVIDGTPVIFLGKTTNGTMQVDAYVKDTNPQASVVLQLQRIGSYYTLAYSYDGKSFTVMEDRLFANFSSENVGVFVSGKAKATFDYVSFGDCVGGGQAVNTPYASGVVDVDYSDAVEAMVTEKTVIVSGTWEYGHEGYYQSEKTGTAQMGFAGKSYEDFKLNVTLKLEDGKGYAAVGFGKSAHDSEEKDGFLLKYTRNDQLSLFKNGVEMSTVTVKKQKGEDALRVILEVKNGNIRVYVGQNASCALSLDNTGYAGGHVCFYAVDTAARFLNNRLTSLSASWNILTSTNSQRSSVFGGVNTIVCKGQTQSSMNKYGAATLLGVGTTDLVTSLEINLGSSTEAGVLVCASEGASKAVDGISLVLNKAGDLVLCADGTEVGRHSLGEGTKAATVMLVKKDRLCQVYIKGTAAPVITYEDTVSRGGTYQLFATDNESRFVGFGLEDIHNISVEDSTLYKLWQRGKLYSIAPTTYRENFNNQSGWESLTKYHGDHGTWEIKDGALSCTVSPGWASGVTIYDRLFSDFNMEFKYRFDDVSDNFAGVLLYKPRIDDTNNTAKYSLLLYSNGNVILYEASTKQFAAQGKIENFEVGKWNQLRVSSVGNNIKVYQDDKCLIDYSNAELNGAEGFISFTANRTLVSFDDVLIDPKK